MVQNYQPGDEPVPGSGYRLTQFLGRGGFGEVWKASAPGGTEAAVKIIHLGDTKGRKEFRAIQVVKRIRHPNLVPITAFWLKGEDGSILDDAALDDARTLDEAPTGETPANALRETMAAPPKLDQARASELIIVMGLGDKSLFDRLEECRQQGQAGLPREELLRYMEDTAEAIDFLNSSLHDLGSGPVAIQHCDIKPHNIMIVGGATQICDFGLARIAGAVRATTTTAGTVAYVAPEFLNEGKPSQSTDQYSLAVTYYELATGRLPYLQDTYLGVANAALHGDLDLSMVSAAEQAVLRRATSLDPAQRYPTCAEMVGLLRQAGQPETRSALMLPPTDQRPAPRRARLFSPLNLLTLAVVVAGLAALGIWWTHGPADVPPIPISPLQRGQQHAAAGQVKLAIADFSEALQDNPDEGEAHFGRGACYLKLAEYDKAIADLQQAQRLEPDKHASPPELAEAFFLRGSQRFEQGDFSAAATDFSEAIRLGPVRPAAYYQRGRCALKANDYDKAIADFEKAAELDPGQYSSDPAFAAAYLARGTRWLEQQQDAKAIADLGEAIRLNPHEGKALSRRGAARYRKGEDMQGAVEDFSAALQIQANDTDLVMRARAYRKLKKVDDALADLREAARLNPLNAAAFYFLGECLLEKEDYDNASAALARAIEIDPGGKDPSFTLADAFYFRAYCFVLTEKYDAAIADLGRAIQLDPKDLLSIYDLRASAFEMAGRKTLAAYDQQIVAALKRLEEKSDDVDACREVALLMASCPQPEIRNGKKAMELARRVCELTAWKDARDLDLLGMACAEAGQFDEAAKWAAKAVELAPDGPGRKQYQQRLEAYRSGKSYHQPASPAVP